MNSSAKCFRGPLLENASLLCPLHGPMAPETASPSHLGVPLALTCLPLRLSEILKSDLSKGKQCEKSNLPVRKISIYRALQQILPPFQNMFLALPLCNQRPMKVLFPTTEEQVLLKHEFIPHFFWPYYRSKSGSQQGARIRRRTLEIKQLLEPPHEAFQKEQHN